MHYKSIFLVFFVLLFSCEDKSKKINYTKKFATYNNKGFALIYDEKLFKSKIVNKKLNNRSLLIFNNTLENETPVRVTNLLNGKYLVAKVGRNAKYPFFYNSVISKRIASNLLIDLNEPYVEIKTLNQDGVFLINKAKTFDEEKEVANKVPVEGILVENIGKNALGKIISAELTKDKKIFKYIIKIADLYFENSAQTLKNRLLNEYNIKNIKIKKMSKNSYRIYLGPFNNLGSIRDEYNKLSKLEFENIEILKL